MYRVVVVEDSLLLRKGLVFTTDWSNLDCEVVGEADNGLEGLDTILAVQPDIVITDIRMPGLDGLQMIERLQGKTEALFIIITAYNEFEYARKAVKLGVMDYISKPIDDGDFQAIIRKTCLKVEQNHENEKIRSKLERIGDSRIMLFKEYLTGKDTIQGNYAGQAVQYIEKHYREDFGVKEIARQLAVSEGHLSRLFKETTGYTIGDYLQNYRIRQACRLLSNPMAKIYEIADQTGYRDQRYFSVMFKKIVGLTPREFQNKLNNPAPPSPHPPEEAPDA